MDKLLEFIQGTPSPATNGVHKKRRAKSKTSRHTSKGEVDSSADQGITNGNHTLIRTSSSSSDSSTLNQLSQASQPSGEKIVDGSDSGICLPSPNGLLMAAKSSSDDLEVGLDEQDFKQVNRKKNTKQVKSKFQYKQQEKLKRKPQVFNSTQRPPNNRHGANNQMSSESAGKQGPKGNEHTPINTNTPIDLGFSAFPALEAGGQVAGPKTSVSLPESTSVTDDEQDSVKSQPASCFSSHQSWANIAAAKKLLPASTHCNSISTSHEPANLSLPQCGGENAESASDTHHLHSTSASSTSQLSVETTHSNLSTSSPDSNQSIQSITTVSHAYSPSESAPSTSVLALASCTSATPQLFQLTDEPEPDGSVSELLKGELPANASQQAGDAPRIEFGTVMSSRDGRTDQQVKDILSTSIYEEGSIVDATSSTGDSIPLGNMHKLSYGNSPPLKYPSKPKAANQTRAVEFLDHRGRCKSYEQVNITFGCFDSATSLEDTPLMSRSYPSDNHLLPAVDSSSDVTTDQGNIIHWILSQRPATGRKVGTVSSPGSRSRRVVPPGTGKPVFVDKFNVTAAVRMLRAGKQFTNAFAV